SSFDRALGAAMRAVVVPPSLRGQLLASLSATRGSQMRRKAFRSVALAASMLLTGGLAFGGFSGSRPRLATTALVLGTDEQLQSPELVTRQWLEDQKFSPDLPWRFDFDLYVTHGTQPVQGRDVPCVVFRERSGPGFAKVFLFRPGIQFDLKG